MTKRNLTKRIATYEKALTDKRITAKEFDGFIEALAKEAAGA